MALLLAMYQKMRLIRERNQLTLDLTKYTSKVNRVEKNIQKVQKRYTSLFAQIESQAKMMESNAKNLFLNMAGLGASQINPYDYSGITQYVINNSWALCKEGRNAYTDNNGTEYPAIEGLTSTQYQSLLQQYRSTGKISPVLEEAEQEGKTVKVPKMIEGNWGEPGSVADYGDVTQDQVQLFLSSIDQAKQSQQQASWNVQQMQTSYASNVSVWVEAQKARLEEEQDAALEPLNYQQTMWELEKEQIEQRLTRIKAEIESYDQLTKDEAQKQAPKFGLG